jgi:hypothetical protein
MVAARVAAMRERDKRRAEREQMRDSALPADVLVVLVGKLKTDISCALRRGTAAGADKTPGPRHSAGRGRRLVELALA